MSSDEDRLKELNDSLGNPVNLSMGVTVEPFHCEICHHDWRIDGGCAHIRFSADEKGNSVLYDKSLFAGFYTSHDKGEDMNLTHIHSTQAGILFAAIASHQANKDYCETLGDESQVDWDEAPGWQKESAIDGARKIFSGEITGPGQSHVSWMEMKLADGWTYGEVKDAANKTHPCLVKFSDLPIEQQKKDHIFFKTVKDTMAMMGLG